MFIEFSVGNFRSFKDTVTLSAVAATIRSQPPELDTENVFVVDDQLSLLKSVAVYGANASGKSNIIAALRFMRFFVLNSLRELRVSHPLTVEPFRLSTEMLGQPSHFEVVVRLDGVIYRYGFEITAEQITSEWLFHSTGKREAYLFKRDATGISVNQRTFREGQGLEPRTRADALFLSVAAQFNSELALRLIAWFSELMINLGVDDPAALRTARQQFSRLEDRQAIVAFIKQLDLGIEDLAPDRQLVEQLELPTDDLEPTPLSRRARGTTPRIKTFHQRYDGAGNLVDLEPLDLDDNESQGTQRLFILAQPLLHALRVGGMIAIDEIDARLHPLLTRAIMRLFNARETNPRNAQLICTTHDTNLLDARLLRRDQIWFVEKSRRGVSDLYSLVEYRVDKRIVRNDASFEKDYIAGRYGAIPYLGSLASVLGTIDDETQETESEN
ncbi:ATP-binding protein [Oscillochloris sp. ZM17-4]|uniref:AAA family ATPase n=1 Tax=Oscillochloris sp. ZM17-4 TaxID=2866714 RepID=UPI001C7337CB|nr:ATP-binding protein [Oscillochloris sp. ZM17-4]MBX0330173.1 ATP-binding protein [Oscillochloris sp. ZM17-4]